MATSRTGTAKWKRLRTQAIRQARRNGQTHCPLCRTEIQWDTHGEPFSPEADHIVEKARGGADALENIRIICRHCNGTRGGHVGRARKAQRHARRPLPATTLATSGDW